MDIINEHASHQKFGIGTIIEQNMTMVTVEFGKEYGIKKFLYPAAFESFLELCDPTAKKLLEKELCEIREQKEAKKQRCAEEEMHRLLEERRSLLAHKRTAAKKRSATSKN